MTDTTDIWQPKLALLTSYIPGHIIISQENGTADNPRSRQYVHMPFDETRMNKIFKKDLNLYELLPDNLPRKFIVDIDIKPSHANYGKYTYTQIADAMNTIVEYGNIVISDIYDKNVIISIVKKQDRKQSLHLIYSINFRNKEDGLLFARYVEYIILNNKDPKLQDAIEIIKHENEIYFDRNVYGSNQNLRMINQSKKEYPGYKFEPYDKKIKLPILYLTGIYKPDPEIIYANCLPLLSIVCPAIHTKLYKKHNETDTKETSKQLDTIITYFEEFSSLVIYDDIPEPSLEEECKIKFLVTCIPNSDKQPQSYKLWYSIGQSLKNIAITYKKDELTLLQYWIDWSNIAATKYKKEDSACKHAWEHFTVRPGKKYMMSFLYSIANYYYPLLLDKYNTITLSREFFITKEISGFDKHEKYNERYCRYNEIDNLDGFLIKSGMGTGKSYFINKLAQKHNFTRILMISPRKAFSLNKVAELRTLFPGFTDYTELDQKNKYTWLYTDKLAIQFESLKHLSRVTEETAFDLLILDESESLLYQVSSSTNGSDAKLNFKTLMELIQFSKCFIMADGYSLSRSVEFAREIKNLYNKKIMVSVNDYMYTERTAVILSNIKYLNEIPDMQNKFLNHLLKSLKENKKICVAMGSKRFQEVIVAAVRKQFGQDYGIKHYDSESNNETMADLKEVTTCWSNPIVRLVIYTTKITVGIDFNEKDIFDCIYIYGSSNCPIARDLLQGHFRVRHIKDQKVYISLYSGVGNPKKPTYADEAKKNVYIDHKFSSEVEKTYAMICNYNSLEEQLGRYGYDRMFMHFLKEIGYTIKYDHTTVKNTLIVKDIRKTVIEAHFIKDYHTIKILTDNEVTKIRANILVGNASIIDQQKLKAYNFDKYVLSRTTISEMSEDEILENIKMICEKHDNMDVLIELKQKAIECELSFKDYIECNIYNSYCFCPEIKTFMTNILREISKRSVEDLVTYNRNSVKSDQCSIMMLESIKHLCDILQIKNSFDTTVKIDDETILKYYKYYTELQEEEKSIFNTNFKMEELNAKNDILKAKHLINIILKQWNGHGFTRMVKTRVRTKSKRIKVYENYVEENDNVILNLFTQTLDITNDKVVLNGYAIIDRED